MSMRNLIMKSHHLLYAAVLTIAVAGLSVLPNGAVAPDPILNADLGLDRQVLARIAAASSKRSPVRRGRAIGAMSPEERRAAVDAYWGDGPSTALGLPTQPALGTNLDLGPDWFAHIAETNTYRVGAPNDFLIHTEFPVDEAVWLRPDDFREGRDTVVEAALAWLRQQTGK